jgi:hypothetical protein
MDALYDTHRSDPMPPCHDNPGRIFFSVVLMFVGSCSPSTPRSIKRTAMRKIPTDSTPSGMSTSRLDIHTDPVAGSVVIAANPFP